MANHFWDLKANYMLMFAVCKYGTKNNTWQLIAKDLSRHMVTTAENCQIQFQRLCEQYDSKWKSESGESFHEYIYSVIKRLYYDDLCGRMTESRDLLMATYDFIRLFKSGCITPADIQEILRDIRQNTKMCDRPDPEQERQEKLKMLERLKLHMSKRIATTNVHEKANSFYPMELLPEPSFLPMITNQQDLTNRKNVIDDHSTLNEKSENKERTKETNVILDQNSDRTKSMVNFSVSQEKLKTADKKLKISSVSLNSTNESTETFEEPMEINELSNVSQSADEISNSNDRDLYDPASGPSTSNHSTIDTGLSLTDPVSSNINGPPTSSSIPINPSTLSSNSHLNSDSNAVVSMQNGSPTDIDSTVIVPSIIPVEDDEVARMDAEQIPEPVPADPADIIVPNDNAVFAVDELINDKNPSSALANHAEKENQIMRESLDSHYILPGNVTIQSTPTKRKRNETDSPMKPTNMLGSINIRKSINTILNSLKDAKHGADYSKPLKSFKLDENYYRRIKKPIDIPEIRHRMNNGDYDENFKLFQRDALLMFTNAVCMYDRNDEIHCHAQEMIRYSVELFASLESESDFWKTKLNASKRRSEKVLDNASDLINHGNHTAMGLSNQKFTKRTSSAASSSSSIQADLLVKNTPTKSVSAKDTSRERRRKTNNMF